MFIYSQFCGLKSCCIHKERRFPYSPDGSKGSVCKICDRKFFMFESYREYAAEIEEQDAVIQENQKTL